MEQQKAKILVKVTRSLHGEPRRPLAALKRTLVALKKAHKILEEANKQDKNKDFGKDSGNNEITKTAKNEKKSDVFNRQKKGKMNN